MTVPIKRYAGIFTVALAIRVVHILLSRQDPFFESPPLDAGAFDRWAVEIAGGDLWGKDAFYLPPLYPYFLSLVYAVFGRDLLAARLVQAVIDSLSCVLICRIGRRCAGDRAGWIAGGLAVLYAPFIFFQGMILETTLALFLIEASLLCLLVAPDRRGWSGWVGWGGAGLLLGLASLARPSLLLLLPVALLWGWFTLRRHGPRAGRLSTAARLAVLLAAATVPVAPVTVRNLLVGHDEVLIASNTGPGFYIGNNPGNRTGAYHPLPGIRREPPLDRMDFWILAIRESGGRPMSPSQVSRFYLQRGLEFITSRPGAFLLLLGKKVLLFFNHIEVEDNQNIYFLEEFAPVLRLPLPAFGFVAPFGLAGLVLLWRRSSAHALLGLYTVTYAASVVAFYVVARYRLPVVPALIVFAGAAADEVWRRIEERGPKSVWPWGVWIVGLGILVNIPLPYIDRGLHRAHTRLGRLQMERGEDALAIARFEKAIECSPDAPEALHGLGTLRLKGGDLDGAEEAFGKLAKLQPRRGSPLYNLGIVHQARGDEKKAAEAFLRSIEVEPGFTPAFISLAEHLEKIGEMERALEILGLASKYNPEHPGAHFTRGRLLERKGRYREAARAYEEAGKLGYSASVVHYRRAFCYASIGDREGAFRELARREAMGVKTEPADLRAVLEALAR